MSNLDLAIRSLYRLDYMKSRNFPDIMIQLERDLLTDRFSKLSADNIYYIVTNWQILKNTRAKEFMLESNDIFEKLNENSGSEWEVSVTKEGCLKVMADVEGDSYNRTFTPDMSAAFAKAIIDRQN